MKFSTKLKFDRWIGPPAVFILTLIVRIISPLGQKRFRAKVKNIVIIKFYGLGSIIQATPLIKGLKETFPGAKVTLLTAKKNKPLIERLSCIDDVLYVDESSLITVLISTYQIIGLMYERKIDLIFDLELYSNYSACLSALSGAYKRYGFFRLASQSKNSLYSNRVFFNTGENIRTLYLQLGITAGVSSVYDASLGPIQVYASDHHALSKKLSSKVLEKFVVINPNASELCLERRWPLQNFSEVISILTDRGIKCVLIGSQDEIPYVMKLENLLTPTTRKKVVNTTGKLNFGELLALIQRSQCILTNDTGPMHIAVTFKKTTFCLFGPVNPRHYGFDELFSTTFYNKVYCSPCLREFDFPPCRGNNICMQMISSLDVLKAILDYLEI